MAANNNAGPSSARANFGTKIGAILAAAGSAVGLGNIWRFPYETGNHGGAAFILIYLACLVVIGLPIMMAEFVIGRHARANTAKAYRVLAPGTHWHWLGRMGILAGFMILSFYSVVAGWTLYYLFQAVTGALGGLTPEEFIASYNTFVANPWQPALCLLLFMAGTHFVVAGGVQRGIERSARILMPVLFVLLLLLAVCSVSLPGAKAGIDFLLKPDWSKVTADVLLSAMRQAFFSLSLGLGCLSTYASYFRADTRLPRAALNVAGIDTMVAILAGFMIFPAAFSVGIQPDAGSGLIFITLPNVFQRAFGGWPALAMGLSIVFYLLLALAALTSTISQHEMVTVYLHEEFNMSRSKAARLVSVCALVVGLSCSLSLGVGRSSLSLFGMTLFDLFDYLTAKIMLPLGGFFISIFVGWKMDRAVVWEELNRGSVFHLYKVLIFLMRFVAPIGIALIFVNELGLL